MNFFDYVTLAYLILFCIILFGRVVILRKRGVRAFVIGQGKKGFQLALEVSFFVGLIIWSIEVVAHAVHLSFHIFPAVFHTIMFNRLLLKIIGVVLICLGYVIFIVALRTLGRSLRIGIDNKHPDTLVTDGIFALSRNPIFLSLFLLFIGMVFIHSNLFFLISAAIVVFGFHYQVLQEEKFLLKQYGESYRRYMSTVRRYF